MKSPLYVFAGGGTGGHLAPGIAVAEQLRFEEPECRIRFVGSGRPVERQMLEPTGFELTSISSLPLSQLRRRPHRFLLENWKAYQAACRSVRNERPSAIIGLGGFASVPLVLAAQRYRVPGLLLEQNSVPGRANRWLSRRYSVCLTFEESAEYLPPGAVSHLTGNPLRREIVQSAGERGESPLEPPTLLVLGGSLGSQQINASILAAVKQCVSELHGWRIVHQTGPDGVQAARDVYSQLGIAHEVEPFFVDMPDRYARTTLAVARAGATTLAELAAVGIPAVLVPYPTAADDHQTRNAQVFCDAGAAVMAVSPARDFSPVDLAAPLQSLVGDTQRLSIMSDAMRSLARTDATADVVSLLRSVVEQSTQG